MNRIIDVWMQHPTERMSAHAMFAAGILSVVGYLAFLIAATYLPIGPVSAIRECSTLFGVFVLQEPFGAVRAVGALLMTLGIAVPAVI
jgi:drug/metabolite transporter (DMT)-like permease